MGATNALACTCDFEIHVTQSIFISRLSDRIATLPSSAIIPIAIPAIPALIGTPASMSAIDPAQTVAIEDDPLDLEYIRDDPNSIWKILGITFLIDLPARLACPTSLLPGISRSV
ncbi:MAG: hypothetical protein U0T81_14355 [Saprospiraceae bacterium]